MNRSHITFIILLVMLLFSIGCIEHNYHLRVFPDGSVFVHVEMKGDNYDFADGHEQFPPEFWNTERDTLVKDDETMIVISGSAISDNLDSLDALLAWSVTSSDTVFLQKSAVTTMKNRLFGVEYSVEVVFHSRRFDDLYGSIWEFVPEECRSLDDPAAEEYLTTNDYKILEQKFALGILQWNRSRYAKRMKRTWMSLKQRLPDIPDTSSTIFSIVSAGWEDDVHRYLNQLDIDEPSFASLDWWDDLRPVFLGRIVDVCGVESIILAKNIVEAVEEEYEVTRDLEDDVIKFSMVLPGKITQTNGLRMEDGSVEWEVKGREVANEDVTFKAVSFEPSLWRIALSAMALLILIRTLRRVFRKKKGSNR